jgi:hypothetical protein
LAPVMGDRLKPGCVILLDDASRSEERAIAERWGAELRASYELLGDRKPYLRMTVRHEMLNGADLHWARFDASHGQDGPPP